MTRLVLLGGGHAHLFVLESLAQGGFGAADVTLVSAVRYQAYSGMVPALIGGAGAPEDVSFDLAAIARNAGVRYVSGTACRIRADAGRVELADRSAVEYDVLSVATGSTLRGLGLPGVMEHALPVKPIERAAAIAPALATAVRSQTNLSVIVVGGGAAGIEIACAIRARLRLITGREVGAVTLLETTGRLFGGRLPLLERLARRALARNAITLRTRAEVVSAAAGGLRLSDGTQLPAHVLVWATGPAATNLLRTSGLALDEQGFLAVDDRLRSVSHPAVFVAGDAATPLGLSGTPKAGVHAVRAGPVLRANLAAACRGAAPMAAYHPRAWTLALLNTGDGCALASYGPLAASGRWALAVKGRIDRGFVRRFKGLERHLPGT